MMPSSPLMLLAALLSAGAAAPVDFDTEIVPILTKAGCNAGACHGAAIGRGGFKLSLYGGDPTADYRAIVFEVEGRRVNLADPKLSLLLLKPTEVLNHGGGTRLEFEGAGATRLLDWIEAGAQRLRRRRIVRVDIEPPTRIVKHLGATVELRATARFDDGQTANVTRWTTFTPEDPAAIEIDPVTAEATVRRRGRHVIVARFASHVLPVTIDLPFRDRAVDLSEEPRRNLIDHWVLQRLSKLHIPVSPLATDATLVRRLRLDLTGRLPTPEEVREYAIDSRDDKWQRLVDRLLKSDAFADYWTYKFAKLLQIRSQPGDARGTLAFHNWLRKQIHEGAAYDRFATTLLTALGDSHVYGPANFYRAVRGPREQAEYVSRVFMGVRLQCANCHNHPFDRWTQDDYHGFAAVFAKIESGQVVKIGGRGQVTHPRTGQAAVPRIPGYADLDQSQGKHGIDGRKQFANWLTSSDNNYFARAIVNRLWASMMGRGLAEPVDDLRPSNPATHPELLDALAADFVTSGYDLRHTLRRIALSSTYGRSSQTVPDNRADARFYSHALPRRLEPEVLADAISDVTDVWDKFGSQPEGTRAVTLFDPRIPSPALDILGRCSRTEACDSPTAAGASPGISTQLHLINGPLINRKIAANSGRLQRLIAAGQSDQDIMSGLYLRSLGRDPDARERKFWDGQFVQANGSGKASQKQRVQSLEDFLWALLTCRDFVTNH